MAKKKPIGKGRRPKDGPDYIGRHALLEVQSVDRSQDPIYVPVEVIDATSSFGRTDLLIKPIGGKGEQWVGMTRLTFKRQN